MANAINLTIDGTVIPVLDHIPMLDLLEKTGFTTDDLDGLNSFTYGILPKASSGHFLVPTSALLTINPDTLLTYLLNKPVSLSIVGQTDTFTHAGLFVKEIRHINTSAVGWTPWQIPDHVQGNITRVSAGYVSVIYLVDIFHYLDDIVLKDYNLPGEVSPYSFSTLIDQLLSICNIEGGPPTKTVTGFPDIAPVNVLSAGCTVREVIKELADKHYLVAYADKATASPGKIIITNADPTITEITDAEAGRLLYSSYGSTALPKKAEAVFMPQVCSPGTDWIKEEKDITKVDDTNFLHNQRYQFANIGTGFLYPFYDLDPVAEDATTQSIIDILVTNYATRTKRSETLFYKDIIAVDLGATVNEITYGYTEIGFTTGIISLPLEPFELSYTNNFVYRRCGNGFTRIEFIVDSATTVNSTLSPFDGMRKLVVTVKSPSCNRSEIWDTTVDVYEHQPACITGDETDIALVGRKGWAYEGVHQSMANGAPPGELTPCHYVLDGLCCPP